MLGAGCGVGAGGDEDDVRSVVSSYVQASSSGNGRQACAYYTPELRARIDASAKARGVDGCEKLLSTAVPYRLAKLPADVRADVQDASRTPSRWMWTCATRTSRWRRWSSPGGAMTETRWRS